MGFFSLNLFAVLFKLDHFQKEARGSKLFFKVKCPSNCQFCLIVCNVIMRKV